MPRRTFTPGWAVSRTGRIQRSGVTPEPWTWNRSVHVYKTFRDFSKKKSRRSQVQGSPFRVKDKDKIKDPKFSRQMLVLPHNCQGSARFQIEDDKANASLIKRFQNGLREPDETLNPDYVPMESGLHRETFEPWTSEPVNGYLFLRQALTHDFDATRQSKVVLSSSCGLLLLRKATIVPKKGAVDRKKKFKK